MKIVDEKFEWRNMYGSGNRHARVARSPGEAAGGAPLAPVRLQRSREEDVRRFIVEADRRV